MAEGKLVGGVRMHHKTLRNCVYTVPLHTREYKVPFICPMCAQTHTVKTYHLELDNDGDVIVSRVIANRLKEAGLPDLEVLNVVRNPPKIRMNVGGMATVFRIEEKQLEVS